MTVELDGLDFDAYEEECLEYLQQFEMALTDKLAPNTTAGVLAENCGLWPRMTRSALLRCLNHQVFRTLNQSWKKAIAQYGVAMTKYQQARRLKSSKDKVDLLRELTNPGHEAWDPVEHSDWLLLEIESNLMIRQTQAEIAKEMLNPSGGQNSVMQLNMGEGKSSVIVPIAAAALADRTRLVRVIVLKPLSNQMFQLLVSKLGGMIDRRIYYMPFSRSMQLTASQAKAVFEMYRECMRVGGILLVQPEHMLSFDLMGLERLSSGEKEIGSIFLNAQKWLDHYSRDILDGKY